VPIATEGKEVSARKEACDHDLRKAELGAEAAEDNADDAVSFAIAAVQEAEYAALGAALARSDADTLADTS
jgi:hypothetical protein